MRAVRSASIFLPLVLEAASGVTDAARADEILSFFEANHGQYARTTLFASRDRRGAILLERNGHTLLVGGLALRFRLAGGASTPRVEGTGRKDAVARHFTGGDPKRWRTGIELFERVEYRDVYPGIRMVHYRGPEGDWEHDFVIEPGADPNRIRFRLEGAPLSISPTGDLTAATPAGPVVYRKPRAFQGNVSVRAEYRLSGGEVSFQLGAYDRTSELVIDPVIGLPVTHGGSDEDAGINFAMDSGNNLYAVGVTRSADFPGAEGAPPVPNRGGFDVFVMKLAPDLRTVLWTTFLGGAADDFPQDIEIDRNGAPVVFGHTASPDFPTRNAT